MKFVNICRLSKWLLEAVDPSELGPGITGARRYTIRFCDGTVIKIIYLYLMFLSLNYENRSQFRRCKGQQRTGWMV